MKHGAKDGTVRGTALKELEAMEVRTSQYNPEQAIPEKSWAYWIAKKLFFNDFGAPTPRRNHATNSAPAVIRQLQATTRSRPAGRRITLTSGGRGSSRAASVAPAADKCSNRRKPESRSPPLLFSCVLRTSVFQNSS